MVNPDKIILQDFIIVYQLLIPIINTNYWIPIIN